MDGEALRARLRGLMDLRFGERQLPAAAVRPGGIAAGLPAAPSRCAAATPAPGVPALAGVDRAPGADQPASGPAQPAPALPDADRLIDVGPRTLQWREALRSGSMSRSSRGRSRTAACRRPSTRTPAICSRAPTTNGCSRSASGWRNSTSALEGLAHELEEAGRLADAIACAERLQRTDALREDTTACSCASTTPQAMERARCAPTTCVPRLGARARDRAFARNPGVYESLLAANSAGRARPRPTPARHRRPAAPHVAFGGRAEAGPARRVAAAASGRCSTGARHRRGGRRQDAAGRGAMRAQPER